MKHLIVIIALVFLMIVSCKKKTSTPDPDPTPTTTGSTTGNNPTVDVNSVSQASYTLDGNPVSYSVDNTHFSSSGSSGNTNRTYDAGIDNGDTITYINITKGTLFTSGGSPTDSIFKLFYPIASIPYSVNAANGIDLTIWQNHVRWSTSLGTANQSGSSFNIVQTKDDQQGYLYIKTYITFNCKVYNGAGGMKTITNGKFVGFFGNF